MVRAAAIIAGLLLISGAAWADDFAKFYRALPPSNVPLETAANDPTVMDGTGDMATDQERMYRDGFVAIGYSIFEGGLKDPNKSLKLAKKLNARYVIYLRGAVTTTTMAMPLTLPNTTTSTTTGNMSVYGSGGSATGTYGGTTTTYGSRTTYIPITRHRAEQAAVYYAPIQKTGSGILSADLTPAESGALGTNRAFRVRAVRTGSPAYYADIVPGDYVITMNGQPLDLPTWNAMLANLHAAPATIGLVRGTVALTKTMTAPPGWQ